LHQLLSDSELVMEAHHYFQLGMNNLVVCGKQSISPNPVSNAA